MRKQIDTYSKVQFTEAFYKQGILFFTYIDIVQVHIALLKFYIQTALLSHGRNVSGSNMNKFWQFEEINFFITMSINRQVYFAER